MARMHIVAVGIDVTCLRPMVALAEAAPPYRVLPIWIADCDMTPLERARHGATEPRPGTHSLIAAVLAAFDRALARVVITELRQQVYRAELVLDDGTRISTRPSDGLTLALRAGAIIEATPALLDQVAVTPTHSSSIDPATSALPDSVTPTEDGQQLQADIARLRRMLDTAVADDFDPDT